MAGRVYVLVGPPGCGKSVLVNLIREGHIPGFHPVIVSKRTTRRRRADEGEEIVPVQHHSEVQLEGGDGIQRFAAENARYYSWNPVSRTLSLDGPMPFEEARELLRLLRDSSEDKRQITKLYAEANVIGPECDIMYEQYSCRYGLETEHITAALQRGQSAVVIVNDIRAIRSLRDRFGPFVVVIFIYRPAEDIHALEAARGALAPGGGVDALAVERRKRKSDVIVRRYIENMEVFSHVVINDSDEKSDLIAQMDGIARTYQGSDSVEYTVAGSLYD